MTNFAKINHNSLGFEDVFIVPQYSEITSRKHVDTSFTAVNRPAIHIDVPVVSANMDTVTGKEMCIALANAGGIGALHRFMTIEENVNDVREIINALAPVHGSSAAFKFMVSIGVGSEALRRAEALYEAGARIFVIDIAHGHSLLMKNMISDMRESFGSEIYIVAGNVATPEGAVDLAKWGADAVKAGIAGGHVCTTKNITGVSIPQFTAIQQTSEALERLGWDICLIADGGIREVGDIAKALGAGADMVMCGRMFAGCHEAPGERIGGKKVYRGSSSADVNKILKSSDNLPTPEGISTLISTDESPASDLVKKIQGGLQSAFSYSNAKSLKEFHSRCVFGIRKTEIR
jgi:IMP dehydrogenase